MYIYTEFRCDISDLVSDGKRPSVDRIDTSRGYAPGNIRIIDHKENTLLGVEKVKRKVIVTSTDGHVETFESVLKCAEAFGTSDGHVRGWINGRWRPKNGCNFKYA